MRMFLFVCVAALLVGCKPAAKPVEKPAALGTEIEGLRLAGSFSAGGLTVIPIVHQKAVDPGQDVTTLAEAQKAGTVEIRELPDSQVNSLLVINKGDKPLLLLAGDLLIGGKQDRIVAKDTLVPPGKAMQVEAFCVEHGRWSGKSGEFEYSGGVVPQSVKAGAARSDQQEVWDRVAEYRANASPMAKMEDGTTVTGAVEAPEIAAHVTDALNSLRAELEKVPDIVGFVVARDGKVVAVELFSNSKLFQQARDAVLKSYLADAAVGPAGRQVGLSGADGETALRRALDARRGLNTGDMAVTQIESEAGASLPLHGSYGFGK